VVASPNPATAGVSITVTITARDRAGNIATGYTGLVHFTSSDTTAVLPSDFQFTASLNGVHTFTNGVTFNKAGTPTLTVKDKVTTSITATTCESVNPPPLHLKITATASVAGSPFSITVTAQDTLNNTVTTYNKPIHLTSSNSLASLPADYTFTTVTGRDNGVH